MFETFKVRARRPVVQNRDVVACGKKKKKNRSGSQEGDSSPEAAFQGPRIDPNSNVPLRAQLKWLKDRKEYQRKAQLGQKPVVRQTYRRAAKSAEELAAERQEQLALERAMRKRKGDPTLEGIYNSRDRDGCPVLLVDGYNLMHQHARLRKLQQKDSLEAARAQLEQMLADYAGNVNTRVAVVWDAMGNKESVTQKGFHTHEYLELTIIFTTTTEADTFIVRAVRQLLEGGAEYVLVATNDAEERDLARQEGAYVVACAKLMAEMWRCNQDAEREHRHENARNEAVAVSDGRGSVLRQIVVKDREAALNLAAMMARFRNYEEQQQAKALGMDAVQYYAHLEKISRENGRRRNGSE